YLFTSQTLTAQEALEKGLVNRVVPRAELESTVEAMARQIARAPLSTLMATKLLLRRAWETMGFRGHVQQACDLMVVASHSSDFQAMRAQRDQAGAKARQWAEGRSEERAE